MHVKVKNTGKRASDEVVQMYVQHLGSAVSRPQLELKGFKRVRIEAGAEKEVTHGVEGARPCVLGHTEACLARGEGTGTDSCRRIERPTSGAGDGGSDGRKELQAIGNKLMAV